MAAPLIRLAKYGALQIVICIVLYLEKSIWRHNSDAYRPITTKFGRQMQNDMLMTIHRSKSKSEIEFQYGGRPFYETGSSYIFACLLYTSDAADE